MKILKSLKLSRSKLIILVILILVSVIGFNLLSRKKQPALQFATAKKQDIRTTVSSSGNLTGKDTANLKFKSAGKLAYIKVKTGDQVSQYDTIAGLDTQELAIALRQAQNTLTDKQAAVDKIHDDVKGHDADETFTQRQTRTTAEVATNNAYDGVKEAQRAFQDAVIASPISGIVTQAIDTSGQIVSAGDLIAQVVDTSSIYFNTDVDEADISKISLGMNAEVTLDAYPDQIFKGTVTKILPQTKTTASGATVVTVQIQLADRPKNFVNGLSGESAIITQISSNVLTIPLEALRDDNSVVISRNNKLAEEKVAVGISSDTDVEIKNGLTEGENILLNPPLPGSKLN